MNVVFFGTPDFAVASLRALFGADDVNVLAVVSQPDQILGRKRVLTATPVKVVALEYGVPVLQPESKGELFDMVKGFDCDFFIVVAFGMILRQEVLDIPRVDVLNVHGSVLPKYRGPSPIHFALLDGESETGVTVMGLDAGMDHGPVYATGSVDIEGVDDFVSLYDRLANIGADLLVDVLPEIYSGELLGVEQAHEEATYCKMIRKCDGLIDFTVKGVDDIVNMVRAYVEWPFTFMMFEEKQLKLVEVLKVNLGEDELEDVNFENLSDGELFVYEKMLYLKVIDGVLKINSVQLPGKNVVDYRAFLNGYGKGVVRL